jgi:hypothetical protein
MGASSLLARISGRIFLASRPVEMDPAVLDFFSDLGDRCGCKGGTTPGSGTRYGSARHLGMAWVVVAVPAEISSLLLGTGGR